VGANSASFTTPSLTSSTSYWVRVTDTFGVADSMTATVAVGGGPVITAQPISQTIASGTTATLTVGATGMGLSYQWHQGVSPNATMPVGTNSASFTTPPLAASTSYWVWVSNDFGALNSTTATISIGAAPVITSHPVSQMIASGSSATLSVVASGPGLSYQWYQGTSPNATMPVGSSTATYTTPTLSSATSYWVRVSNAYGEADRRLRLGVPQH
jgi:hypothetical protein